MLFYTGIFHSEIDTVHNPNILQTEFVASNIGHLIWELDPQNSKRFFTRNPYILAGLVASKCVLVGQTDICIENGGFFGMRLNGDLVDGEMRAVLTCLNANGAMIEAPFNYTTIKIEIYP